MEQGRDALKWSPRLPKEKLRQLYLTEAKGIYDDELIDDAGISLYMRCRDILAVKLLLRRDKPVRGDNLLKQAFAKGPDTFARLRKL